MSYLNRALQPLLERRAAPAGMSASDPWAIPPPGSALGQMSSAGTVVNSDSALSTMTFFRGVQLISDSCSLLPLNAVTQDADGTRHPVVAKPKMLVDPFMAVSLQEGMSQIIVSTILRGNAYLVAVSWADMFRMVPTCWRILSPDQVRVDWDSNGYRKYTVNGSLWSDQIIHITNFMLPNSLVGAGIIEYCRNAIGLGIALDDVAGEFFRNGIMSTGVIGVDAVLTEDQARATANQFVQNHSGVRRAHLPIVMGGGAKYTPISLTPEDAQFIQSRQFQQGEVATLLGIPPHLLGIVDKTTSWGTGIEVQGRAFVDYTLRPYIQRLQSMFTSWLPDGMYAELETDALTRADSTTRFANYSSAQTAGWLNVDEIRAREGLPPLPNGGGQVYTRLLTETPAADANGVIAAAPAAPIPTDDPNTGVPDAGDEN